MISGDALLDMFINANILFLLGYGFWLLMRTCMRWCGLDHAFGLQLRLLNTVFLVIFAAPVIATGFGALQAQGLATQVNLNLSDAVVAYYLNGGFQMEASRFEALVQLRDSLTLNLLNADGIAANLVIALFLLGFAMGLARLAHSVVCLWRIVQASYVWRDFGRIRLRLSDRTLVPFSTRGLRHYYVVIPSDMLAEPRALRVAIAHELQHIRHGDLEWEIALELLKPLFFLNPAFRAWKRQVERLRELNCDERVLLKGRIDVQSYCETLMSFCQGKLRRDRGFVLAVPKVTLVTADRTQLFGRRQNFLEQRIRSALHVRTAQRRGFIFALLAVPLLFATIWATLAIQSPGDWSQDRLMLSTVVNLDRLDEINRISAFSR